jgi:hypothetical protein
MNHTNRLRLLTALMGLIIVLSGIVSSDENAVALTEDLSIGVGYGDENLMFGSVSDIQLDQEENIYILDGKNDRIQIFNSQGEFLRSIPIQKGQGPKEVSMLLGFAVHPDGFISLYDLAGRKILNFDKMGAYHSYFKLDFQAMDIKSYKKGQIAILGLNNDLGIHIYSLSGEWLSSFAEPFPLPSKLSQYKDSPFSQFPMKFSSSGDGILFLLNPHKYEIRVYENGQLSGKIKGRSDFFRPLTIQGGKGRGGQTMGIIFPTVSVLESKEKTFITIKGLPVLGQEEIKSQMQVYEDQKLLHSQFIEGFPSAVDSEGRLYFSDSKEGFPVMKRCKILFK